MELTNNFESKVSIKIETNSRGYNTTVHCYSGVSIADIADTIEKTISAHNLLQQRLREPEVEGEKK